jgi:hypothetical protein
LPRVALSVVSGAAGVSLAILGELQQRRLTTVRGVVAETRRTEINAVVRVEGISAGMVAVGREHVDLIAHRPVEEELSGGLVLLIVASEHPDLRAGFWVQSRYAKESY